MYKNWYEKWKSNSLLVVYCNTMVWLKQNCTAYLDLPNNTQHLCSHFPLMSHSGQYQAWLLGRCWKSYKCRDSDKMLSFHHFPINPKLSRQWIEKFWRQVGYSFKIKQHIWYPLANFSTTSNLTSLLDITWCKLIFTYIIKIKRQC